MSSGWQKRFTPRGLLRCLWRRFASLDHAVEILNHDALKKSSHEREVPGTVGGFLVSVEGCLVVILLVDDVRSRIGARSQQSVKDASWLTVLHLRAQLAEQSLEL